MNSIKPKIPESHTNETSDISVDSVDSISTTNELVFIHRESRYINSSGNSINSEEDSPQTFLEIPTSNSWFHRPSVLFQISIGTQVTCTFITWLSQPIEICSITTRPSSHVLEASIKTPKETLFCKQAGLYILHTKLGLVVRVHLESLCMFIITSKTNFMFFKQHPWLFTGWLRQYLVRDSTVVTGWVGVYVNILPFEEWLKISSKTLLVMWRRAIK